MTIFPNMPLLSAHWAWIRSVASSIMEKPVASMAACEVKSPLPARRERASRQRLRRKKTEAMLDERVDMAVRSLIHSCSKDKQPDRQVTGRSTRPRLGRRFGALLLPGSVTRWSETIGSQGHD